MRDIETIDSELQLVAALRRAARERGRSLPSIVVRTGKPQSTRPVAIRPGYGGGGGGGTTGRHTLAPGSHQLPGPQSWG